MITVATRTFKDRFRMRAISRAAAVLTVFKTWAFPTRVVFAALVASRFFRATISVVVELGAFIAYCQPA
jgi:hypothetical protein